MDKILSFLEDYVEKIVLGIVAVICLWLLITRVVLTPNVIKYSGQNYSPSKIDDKIRDQARDVEENLGKRATPPDSFKPRSSEYSKLLASTVQVNFNSAPAMPKIN